VACDTVLCLLTCLGATYLVEVAASAPSAPQASTVTSINAELFIVTFALRESPDRKGSAGDACVIDLMRVSPAPATATIR
jgi:hypothetical protein